jgi:hypothetical protein
MTATAFAVAFVIVGLIMCFMLIRLTHTAPRASVMDIR